MNVRSRFAASLAASVLVAAAASSSACAVEYTVPLDEIEIECLPGLVPCGAECIDPTMSPEHCGGCDQPCTPAQACLQGGCVDACPGGRTICGQICVDTIDDAAHCGGCDRACDAEDVCTAGECVQECGESCDDDVELCIDGACTCREGLVRCGDDCVDLSADRDHCGTCDRRCDDACGGGECRDADCPGFPDICEYSCTDVLADPLHCGACDRPCHPSQDCAGGLCVPGAGG